MDNCACDTGIRFFGFSSHFYSILRHEGEGSEDARYALSLRLRFLSGCNSAILIRFFREDLKSTDKGHVIYSATSLGSQLQGPMRRHVMRT